MSETAADPDASPADTADDGVERIADPENYNLRRWLRQLHDAKERVRNTAHRMRIVEVDRNRDIDIGPDDRDRLIAERVADFIVELQTLYQIRDGDSAFGDQTVELQSDDVITLTEFARHRGEHPERNRPISYETSMRVWKQCCEALAELTAPDFDENTTPRTEITDEMLEEVEEWRQKNVQ